jgi:hypothetical protein
MTIDKYDKIKEKYGHVSSWALWTEPDDIRSKSGMGDVSFFENPSPETLVSLNPNIILVALNISEKIPRTFGNFHSDKDNDWRLRFALQGTMFRGAYITDVIKSYEEKSSNELMNYLRKNKNFEKENIETFEQELKDIGSQNPIIVALGDNAYKILKRNLKNRYIIHKVPHYSAYQIKVDSFRKRFTDLENTIKGTPR